MSYIDTIRPARFRGVPFLVDTAFVEGGRRADVYEIAESTRTADLGVVGRRYPISGYLDGDDALEQWRALQRALEVGQGPLVHPTFGELDAQILTYRGGVSRARQMRVEFEFVAVERRQEPPAPSIDVESVMAAATAAAGAAVGDAFTDAFSLDGASSLLDAAEDALGEVLDVLTAPLDDIAAARAFVARVQALRDDARSLLEVPDDFVAAVLGLFADIEDLLCFESATSSAGAEPEDVTGYTPTEAQRAANADAIRQLVTRSGVLAAVSVVATWPWTTWDQLITYRDTYVDRLQAEELLISPAAYDAWLDLRAAFIDSAAAVAEDLVPTEIVYPVDGESAVLMAHRLYGDAERATEIAARNIVDDAGALPAQALRVLTR